MPFARTGDINTYYETHGNGPAIVFIHGAGASHDMWHPQIPYFSETYQVIVYDLRGHQQTEGSVADYTCELMANDLNELLTGLEIKQPVVCGLSLGGMVAQEYAIKYQDNLHGLVLCDTAVATALTWSDKALKAIYPKFLVKWTIRRMSEEKYAEWSFKYYDMKDEIKQYLITEQLKMGKEELLKVTDAIYSFKLLPLETIKVPTLVMLGENEKKAVFTHSEKMLELIPSCRRVVVPDAGHMPNLENPDFFNTEFDDFLRGLVRSTVPDDFH